MNAKIMEMNATPPDHQAIRQWERDEVGRAIAENKVLKTRADRKRVARNLGRILNEVATDEERGLKTRIARIAWPTDDVPLKKLDLVTLPLDAEPSDSRVNRLAGRPKHYARLARAIAQVRGRNRDDLYVEIFRGTQLEAGAVVRANRFNDDHSGDWERLAELIDAMAAAVAERTGLRHHLRRIAGLKGSYSLETATIRRSESFLLPHGPLANGYEVNEEFPPIPSAPLLVMPLAAPIERPLNLVGPSSLQRVIPVTVSIWREVRLAIGPADDSEIPRPMFEFRTVVDIVDEHGRNWAHRRNLFYLEGLEQFTVTDEHGNETTAEIDLGSEPGIQGKWIPLLEDSQGFARANRDGGRQWEHVYATWWPVTRNSCAEILGLRLSNDVCIPQFELEDRQGGTRLPNNLIASWVESALVDENNGFPIEKALESESERLMALVQSYVDELRDEAGARHRRALARWANEGKNKVKNDD